MNHASRLETRGHDVNDGHDDALEDVLLNAQYG